LELNARVPELVDDGILARDRADQQADQGLQVGKSGRSHLVERVVSDGRLAAPEREVRSAALLDQ